MCWDEGMTCSCMACLRVMRNVMTIHQPHVLASILHSPYRRLPSTKKEQLTLILVQRRVDDFRLDMRKRRLPAPLLGYPCRACRCILTFLGSHVVRSADQRALCFLHSREGYRDTRTVIGGMSITSKSGVDGATDTFGFTLSLQ